MQRKLLGMYYLAEIKYQTCPKLPLSKAPSCPELDVSNSFTASLFELLLHKSLNLCAFTDNYCLSEASLLCNCGCGKCKELLEALSSASPMGEAVAPWL